MKKLTSLFLTAAIILSSITNTFAGDITNTLVNYSTPDGDVVVSDMSLMAYNVGASDIVYGDFNCDGVFNNADLSAIQTWLADSSNTDTSIITNNHDYIVSAINVCGYDKTDLSHSTVEIAYNWLTAKLHNNKLLPCEIGSAYRWGDADGDGRVQENDANAALYITLGLIQLTDDNKRSCDMNADGIITASDGAFIQYYLMTGYEVSPLFYILPNSPKTEYEYGDTIEDVLLSLTYEDGSKISGTSSELGAIITVDGMPADTPLDIGTHNIVIIYSEPYGEYTLTKSTTYIVNVPKKVKDFIVSSKDITYIEGQKLDKNNYTVTAFYNNGDTEVITDYSTDKDNVTLTTSDKNAVFTYSGISKTVPIAVREKQLTGITIAEPPAKTNYFAGETFENEGMKVVAEYDNGESYEITDYSFSKSPLVLGQESITISYGGYSAAQSISVNEVITTTETTTETTTKPTAEVTTYTTSEANTESTTGNITKAEETSAVNTTIITTEDATTSDNSSESTTISSLATEVSTETTTIGLNTTESHSEITTTAETTTTKSYKSHSSSGGSSSKTGNSSKKAAVTEKTTEISTIKNVNNADKTKNKFTGFIDVIGHWAEEFIENLHTRGIVNGVTDKLFIPDTSIKRGDAALMIYRAYDLADITGNSYFDVDINSYYAKAIASCTAKGYFEGYGDGTFKPEQPITREEMMVVAAKLYGVKTDDYTVLSSFKDSNLISWWAKPYISALIKEKVVIGSNNLINPINLMTRAEFAVIIYNICR